MAQFPGVPNEFVPNTLADADEVNENFDFIESWLNGKNIACDFNIADGGVEEDCIADGAVTTDKIADDAVTEDKIADGTTLTTPQCRAIRSSAQSVLDATATPLQFNQTVYETVEMHNDGGASLGQVNIPEDGVYSIKAQVKWENTPNLANKTTYLQLEENGSQSIGRADTTGSAFNTQVTVQVVQEKRFTAGDYVRALAYQESGGPLQTVPGGVFIVVRKVSNA